MKLYTSFNVYRMYVYIYTCNCLGQDGKRALMAWDSGDFQPVRGKIIAFKSTLELTVLAGSIFEMRCAYFLECARDRWYIIVCSDAVRPRAEGASCGHRFLSSTRESAIGCTAPSLKIGALSSLIFLVQPSEVL